LPRYKRGILSAIASIRDNEATMDHLAQQALTLKRFDDYNDAFNFVEEMLRYISDSFAALEFLILAIDRKNEQYISAAASKILFLTNHSDDIEGIFNRLFKIVLDKPDEAFDAFFNLVQIRNIDTQSLYNQRRMRMDTIPEAIVFDDDLISDDYRRNKVQALLKNNIYGKKEIDQYVKTLLNGQDVIEAKDVEIVTQEDYIRLILVFLYSKSIGMHYDIDLLNKEVRNNFVSFRNFRIKRKGVRA
jgi:hypothetical protein